MMQNNSCNFSNRLSPTKNALIYEFMQTFDSKALAEFTGRQWAVEQWSWEIWGKRFAALFNETT